ncbi:MAG: hypothetical protein IT318_23780 [Anaerolineales bacterium]|nr:hypothetical protein [Anaerolineales bacterium]
MNSYIVGQTFRLYGDFYSLAGVATDPTTVTLTVEDAAGVEMAYTLAGGGVTKESDGVYYREMTAAAPLGVWNYQWLSTGTVKALDEASFRVIASRLT